MVSFDMPLLSEAGGKDVIHDMWQKVPASISKQLLRDAVMKDNNL